jgi:hypothetical protein
MKITEFAVAPVPGVGSGGGSFDFSGEGGSSTASLRHRALDLSDMSLGEEVEVKSERRELDEPEDGGRQDHRHLGATELDAEEDCSEELGTECHQGQNETEHRVDRLRKAQGGGQTKQAHSEDRSDDAVRDPERPECGQEDEGKNRGDSKLQADFGKLSVHVWAPIIGRMKDRQWPIGHVSW